MGELRVDRNQVVSSERSPTRPVSVLEVEPMMLTQPRVEALLPPVSSPAGRRQPTGSSVRRSLTWPSHAHSGARIAYSFDARNRQIPIIDENGVALPDKPQVMAQPVFQLVYSGLLHGLKMAIMQCYTKTRWSPLDSRFRAP